MPSVSAPNLTLLRTTKHATLLALSVYHPPTIWTARVNGAQTDGDTSIAVDGVVQTRAPFKHAQVLIGTTAGDRDLGDARFKSYSAPTLNVGAHNAALPDDAYITIVEEIKPTAIHVSINSSDVVSEDGDVAYTNENVNYMPVARVGPPAVAYIDPTTGLATVKFYSSSVAMAGSLSSYAWSFRGGTPNTSASAGTAGAPITVTWNAAGEYYCSLTVTDSNGKTHTRYVPVFIYDTTTVPYTQIEVNNLSGDVETGWRATLKVWQAATITEFPDGALCVLSARDWYGDTETSIGGQYTWRENIVFVGYIRNGSVKQDWAKGYVEFQVESVLGVMANMWELASKLTTTTGTPAGWHTLQNMTLNLAAHHVLTQHSTITQITDAYFNLLTYAKNNIDLMDAVLADQLRQFASTPARGRVTSNAQGALYLESNPQLLTLAARAGYTNVLQTTLADLRGELDFGPENQEKQVSRIALSGEKANADPVFSLAPPVPWTAGRSEMQDGIRVDTQTEGNEVAGLFDGWRNNKYSDVVLPLRGNYRVFDVAPQQSVQVNITAAQNKRGISWTNQRCWIKRVSYDYKFGVWLTTIVVEKDAVPSDGVTGVYPAAPPDYPNPPPIPELPPIAPPPIIGPDNLAGKGNLFYVSSLKGVAKCTGAYGTNGTDGTPVWTAINTGLAGDALKVRFMDLDPFSVSGDHFTAMWAMTDDGLYRCTGLPDAATWAQQLTASAANTVAGDPASTFNTRPYYLCYGFTPSVRKAGFIAIPLVYYTDVGKTWKGVALPNDGGIVFTVYSLDYGATWNCNNNDFVLFTGILGDASTFVSDVYLGASYHIDETYYMGGFCRPPRSDQAHTAWGETPYPSYFRAPGCRGTAFPDFSPGMSDGYSSDGDSYGRMCMPYCDNAGAVYANDNRAYLYGLYAGGAPQGVAAIKRYNSAFSPMWSTGYTPPANVNVGNAAMSQIQFLFTNMFNEDTAIAIDPNNIWLTSNLTNASPTWTRKNGGSLTFGGRLFSPTYQYCVPIDVNAALFTGKTSTPAEGVAQVMLTPDFGTSFYDITNHGGANDLDTVLGLALGDMNGSIIQLDYFKP